MACAETGLCYPMPQGITDFVGLIQYIQTILPLAQLIVIVTFILAFIAMKRYESPAAFTVSMFLATIISTIFVALQVLNPEYVYFTLVATALSAILIKNN